MSIEERRLLLATLLQMFITMPDDPGYLRGLEGSGERRRARTFLLFQGTLLILEVFNKFQRVVDERNQVNQVVRSIGS